MVNLSLVSYLPLSTFSSILTNTPKSISNVPPLKELQKQAELLASSIPTFSLSNSFNSTSNTKSDVKLPEKIKSKGLPIPSNQDQQNQKSWYNFSSSPSSSSDNPPKYQEDKNEKQYIDAIDIGHGFDHIHRLGRNGRSASFSSYITTQSNKNKLVKTSQDGFRPILTQQNIPNENDLEPKMKFMMKESKIYAQSVDSLTQPSISNMRENEIKNKTWVNWVSCKGCM